MRIFIFLLVMCIAVQANSQDIHSSTSDSSTTSEDRKWYVPSHANIQFAGGIGMFSAGVGYLYGKTNHFQSDFYFGYVPESKAGKHMYIYTLKQTFYFLEYNYKTFQLYPLSLGLTVNMSNITSPNTDTYPIVPYNFMFTAFMGGKVDKKMAAGPFSRVGFFYEIGTNQVEVEALIRNPATIKFSEIFNLGLGLNFRFK
ncbi:MAG: hypothetical protein ABJH98_19260 [Reichenbachiella sp.]|uniref:hypothetical protein n=1 Tax=Reichenbachiella sp. TaxID=2184521 RepID=UPI0032977D85